MAGVGCEREVYDICALIVKGRARLLRESREVVALRRNGAQSPSRGRM